MEVDLERHGEQIRSMFGPWVEELEVSGVQSGGGEYFKWVVLPTVFGLCENLKSIRFGPGPISTPSDALHSSILQPYLEQAPSLTIIELQTSRFVAKDSLFLYLCHRPSLLGLEIALEPTSQLSSVLPTLESPIFQSLRRLTLLCCPEVALPLLDHLHTLQHLDLTLARTPDQQPHPDDHILVTTILNHLSTNNKNITHLTITISNLSASFPSPASLLVLTGSSLLLLAQTNPKLAHLCISISPSNSSPSALDASTISSELFDVFCTLVPSLVHLSLDLHPQTIQPELAASALMSLGRNFLDLETLKIGIRFDLSELPIPELLDPPFLEHKHQHESGRLDPDSPDPMTITQTNLPTSTSTSTSLSTPQPPHPRPLFPNLTHLAFARSPLLPPSTSSPLSIPDATIHAWAHVLEYHFPLLEELDSLDEDGTIQYVDPLENVLETVWEFLCSVEQEGWGGEGSERGMEVHLDEKLGDVQEEDEDEDEDDEDGGEEWDEDETTPR